MSKQDAYKAALQSKKIPELKALCKEKGLKNYSKLRKDDIISALAVHDATALLALPTSANDAAVEANPLASIDLSAPSAGLPMTNAQAGSSSAPPLPKVAKASKVAKPKAGHKTGRSTAVVEGSSAELIGYDSASDEAPGVSQGIAGPSPSSLVAQNNLLPTTAASLPPATQSSAEAAVSIKHSSENVTADTAQGISQTDEAGTSGKDGRGQHRDSGMGVECRLASPGSANGHPELPVALGSASGGNDINLAGGLRSLNPHNLAATTHVDALGRTVENVARTASPSMVLPLVDPSWTVLSIQVMEAGEGAQNGTQAQMDVDDPMAPLVTEGITAADHAGVDASSVAEQRKAKGKTKAAVKAQKKAGVPTDTNAAASGSGISANSAPVTQPAKKRKLTTKASVNPADKDGEEQAELDGMLLALINSTQQAAVGGGNLGIAAPGARKGKSEPVNTSVNKTQASGPRDQADQNGINITVGSGSAVQIAVAMAGLSETTPDQDDASTTLSAAITNKQTKLPGPRKKSVAKIAGMGPAGIALPGPSIMTAAKAGSKAKRALKLAPSSAAATSIEDVPMDDGTDDQSQKNAQSTRSDPEPSWPRGESIHRYKAIGMPSNGQDAPSDNVKSSSNPTPPYSRTPCSRRASLPGPLMSISRETASTFKGLQPLPSGAADMATQLPDHSAPDSNVVKMNIQHPVASMAPSTASSGHGKASTSGTGAHKDALGSTPATMYSGQVGGHGAKRAERSPAANRPIPMGIKTRAGTTPIDRVISASASSFKPLNLIPKILSSTASDTPTSAPSRSGCVEPLLEFANFGTETQLAKQTYDKAISASWLERNFQQISNIQDATDAEGTPSPVRSFNAISRHLYTNPEHPEQFAVSLRFIIARIHTKLQNGEIEAFDGKHTVTSVTCVCNGVWRITFSNGHAQLICGATGDMIVASSDPKAVLEHEQGEDTQWSATRLDAMPEFALRHDWAAYIAAASSDSTIKLSTYIKSKDNDKTYTGGIAQAFRSRVQPNSLEMIVAERFIMSNLEPSASHQIESVAFNIKQGQSHLALHPAVALVATCGKGTLFCLRSTGQVIGNQDADGLTERWQNILGCDERGVGLTPALTSQRCAKLWSQVGTQMEEV